MSKLYNFISSAIQNKKRFSEKFGFVCTMKFNKANLVLDHSGFHFIGKKILKKKKKLK